MVTFQISASQRLSGSNGFQSFTDWAATDFPDSFANEMPKAEGDDIALLMYTSGTTGTPKGVPLTHGNIVGELSGVNDVLKLSDKERILQPAAAVSRLSADRQSLGRDDVRLPGRLFERADARRIERVDEDLQADDPHDRAAALVSVSQENIRRRRGKAKAGSDAVSHDARGERFLSRHAQGQSRPQIFRPGPRIFWRQLRIAISAGSRFDEAVAEDFHKLGFTIIQGYGLTETSGAATATYEDDNRVGSVGKPMKGAEIKILDPDKDGVGEVLIRGTMVFDGYFRNPTATAEAFTEDGWFRSGDLGRIDSDGFLYIVGRGKDVIVLPSGKNVHPEDLEVHYLKCPLVAELAIIGVADESEAFAGAEKLAAVVVPDFAYLKANWRGQLEGSDPPRPRQSRPRAAGISTRPRLHDPRRASAANGDQQDQAFSA